MYHRYVVGALYNGTLSCLDWVFHSTVDEAQEYLSALKKDPNFKFKDTAIIMELKEITPNET